MASYDPRFHPIRKDLAAASLRENIDAPRYAEGFQRQVTHGALALRREPRDDAPLDTELLYGECVHEYDEQTGWAWVQNETDGYVGYVRTAGLSGTVRAPTHKIQTIATFVYPKPDIKAPPLRRLSMGAHVTILESFKGFCRDARGGWIYERHLAKQGDFSDDHAGTALQFLETPYLWGGRTSLGLDCSALVQLALNRCGVKAPRDTDIQVRELGHSLGDSLGEAVLNGDTSRLKRGDLVFWRGHVGIYVDAQTFVHANATDMKVSAAPLPGVARAIKDAAGERITDIRRL